MRPEPGWAARLTVRVTAAVHRGFRSKLALLPLTFRHRAGVSLYTLSFLLAQTCVFVKQSPGLLLCAPRTLHQQVASPPGGPFLPKLQGSFVYFLSGGYLERLGTFIPAHQWRFAVRSPLFHNHEAFLVGLGPAEFRIPKDRFPQPSALRRSGFACPGSPTVEDTPCPIGMLCLPFRTPPWF